MLVQEHHALHYGLAVELFLDLAQEIIVRIFPKKVKRLARKSAFSYKVKDEQLFIVEDFNLEQPKTKEFTKILNALKVSGKKILLLTDINKPNVYKSGSNIPKVKSAGSI